MEHQTLISAEKKAELEKELIHLKSVVRPDIGERLQAARALGDLSENAEYQTSRDEQGKNEGRIRYVEQLLKHAKVVERTGSGTVEIGAIVVISKKGSDDEKTYTLVSSAEADMVENKISTTSPIGAAMMGKSAGELFTMETPRGIIEYSIISVT